jgi:hypothetical protein
MPRIGRRVVSRSQAVLVWFGVLFAGVQAGVAVLVSHIQPELRDPEYGSLVRSLEARLAESPASPLVLILGSSRSANIFRPTAPITAGDPVVFNFATLKTGPLRQLQVLRRLLARGIRPAWVVAEVWPPFFNQRLEPIEQKYILDGDLQLPDWHLLSRYFADPETGYAKVLEGSLVPAYSHRVGLLRRYAPFPTPPPSREPGDWSDPALRTVEGFGWLPAPAPRPEPEEFRRKVAQVAQVTRNLFEEFCISPVSDGALRELLQTCAGHAVRVILTLGPEHSYLSSIPPPDVSVRVRRYLTVLSDQEHVPVIDTRDWVSDDNFIDLTHVLPRAAAPYTERFGREVLRPLLEGRPLAPRLVLGGGPSPSEPASLAH